ncbi:MAG TPA: hypothetical protein VFG68_01360 [Fimbriiglobus sp.]|nr:hypothetical protein [Fimbriiglobus sp.]
MVRRMWSTAAVAVGVALGGSAVAGDDTVKLGRFQPQPGGFAGAVRSAADAEPARAAGDDTVLVHGYRGGFGYRGGYFGGYRGFSGFSIGIGIGSGYWPGYYGGYGYGFGYPRYGYGLGGFGYGWPRYGYGYGLGGFGYGLGYSSFYRPGFSISLYSAPRSYYPSYSYGYSSYFPYSWCRIGGLAGTVRTPAAVLGNAVASNGTAQLLPPPTPLGRRVPDGTFRYDGGPIAPVPMPTPDPTAPETIEPAREQPTSVPISLPARKPAYKYPAYGDKR